MNQMRSIIVIILILIALNAFSQSGPGGVGNTSNNKVWLRADKGVYIDAGITPANNSEAVQQWNDQSGNNYHVSQATLNNKPLFISSSVNLNNKSSLSFDGLTAQNDYLQNTSFSGIFGGANSQQITAISVVRHNTGDADHAIFEISNGVTYNTGVSHLLAGTTFYSRMVCSGADDVTSAITLPKNGIHTQIKNTTDAKHYYFLNSSELGRVNGPGTFTNALTTLNIGTLQNYAQWSLKGELAEFIVYNSELNDAQRIIVENYLSSKYGIVLTANDKYAFDAVHGNDVSGIGQEVSGSNTDAISAEILEVSNASSINNGRYLLFGHDGADISSWTTSDCPDAGVNVQRIAREWRFDKTNNVGTVKITIPDTALLPAKPDGYSQYVLLIDNDGDFTNGALQYSLTTNGAGVEVPGVSLSDGDYISFGIIKPVVLFLFAGLNDSESATPALIDVVMNYYLARDITFTFNTGGDADDGVDYSIPGGTTVTIFAGNTSASISVDITNDTDIEPDESIVFNLFSASWGVTIGDVAVHTYTINDDDNARKIEFSSVGSNNTEDITPITVTIEINAVDAFNPTYVDYTVTGGTALGSGDDFTLVNGTATIPAGSLSTTFDITIVEDAIDEVDEDIVITLSNPSNASLGINTTYSYIIEDNDSEPEVEFTYSISSYYESSTTAFIEVNLSNESGQDVMVNYEVTGGTAVGGYTDYFFADGTLIIPAGDVSANIDFTVIDDGSIEPDETIEVTLSGEVSATLGANSVHTYTISDNDNLSYKGPGGVGDETTNKLWLRGDVGVYSDAGSTAATNGGTVQQWNDQSGNGYNVTQLVAANKPLFASTSASFNNQSVLTFDGITATNDYLQNTAFTGIFGGSGSQQVTTFAAVKQNSGDTEQAFFEISNGVTYNTGISNLMATTTAYSRMYCAGGNDVTFNVGALPNTSIHTQHKNSTHTYFLNGTSVGAPRAGQGNFTNALTTLNIGTIQNYGQWSLKGEMAEIIVYKLALNTTQRTIVENYLAAKYGVTISNDMYAHNTFNGKDVAGIGQESSSDYHSAARSAGIFKISNASDLDDGEYFLFGHDGGSVSSWTTTDCPNTGVNTQRIAREWKVDKDNVGTVTVSLDTALLPAKPADYYDYVAWFDADGDFATGATQYAMSLSGGSYIVTGVTITDGSYVSFGIIKPLIQFTLTSSNGNEATTPASLNVSLNYALNRNVSVNYTITGGTAIGLGTDYNLPNGSITITAGNTSANINIAIVNDISLEPDETIVVSLYDPSTLLTIGSNSSHTYTINDDDNARKIDFSVATNSGDEDITPITVSVQINSSDAVNVTTVDYSVTSGTATGAGEDYTLASGTATVNINDLTTTFDILIVDDALDESNETIVITLSSPTNSNIGVNNTYTYTINDNDDEPSVQFTTTSSSSYESTTTVYIEVSLSAASGQDITIDYQTIGGGSASGGGVDYTLNSGTLTIPAESQSANISFIVVDDGTIETDETINIQILNPTGATLGGNTTHTYTISDNDNLSYKGPGGVGDETTNKLWLRGDVGVYSDAGSTAATNGGTVQQWNDQSGNGYNVTQLVVANQPLFASTSASFNNQSVLTFDGITAQNDYLQNTAFTGIFGGAGSQQVTTFAAVKQNSGDTEQAFFEISNGVTYNTGISNLMATTTAYSRVVCSGGNDVTFNVGALPNTSIHTQHKNSTHTYFLNGTSVGAPRAGQGNFTNALTTLNIGTIQNYGQWSLKGEMAEIIVYKLALNTTQRTIVENYLAAKYGVAISNDNYAHQAVHSYDVAGIGQESASDYHTAARSAGIFKVSNASNLGNGEYFMFGHDGGSISSWTTTECPNAGSDLYRTAREWRVDKDNVGTVTVSLDTALLPIKPAGYTTYVVWIDSDGNFSTGATQYPLNLVSGSYIANGLTVADGSYIAFGIMKPVVQFTVISLGQSEAATPATIEVSLNYPLGQNTTVSYTVIGGTATGGGVDYTLSGSSVIIPSGSTTANISIAIINDVTLESDETVELNISTPSWFVNIGTNSVHTLSINDDDNPRKIEFTAINSSGDESILTVTITVEINSIDAINPTTVIYTATSGTATGDGTDYTLVSGIATVPIGDLTTTFDLTIINDLVYESDETVIITLSDPINSNIGINDTYTYTINDNDVQPTIEFTTLTVSGFEDVSPTYIEVTLSSISGEDITIDYDVIGGTATGGGTDYTLANGTLTIPAGDLMGYIEITINNDVSIELDETIDIELSSPTNSSLGGNTTNTFTILDNDASVTGFTGPGGVGNSTYNKLWLRSDVGVYSDAGVTAAVNGGAVQQWNDQSGNGFHVTQLVAANKPLFASTSASFNNRPVLTFDGITAQNDYLQNASFSGIFGGAGSQQVTTFAAVKYNSGDADQAFFEISNGVTYNTGVSNLMSGTTAYSRIYCSGGNDVTYNVGALPNTAIHTQHKNSTHTYYLNGTSVGAPRAGQGNFTNTLTTLNIGTLQNYAQWSLKGEMAEIIVYKNALNTAQRIIVENYLSAKYGIALTANDKYAYQATHSNDVAGIGYEDATNYHTAAQSAGILKISNASSLDANGDYILFGHEGSAYNVWSTTESPSASIERIAREWRVDISGTLGAITITVDTALFTARNANFNGFAILTDADGDFSAGATVVSLSSAGGTLFQATGVTIADGTYITVAVIKNVSTQTGNFNDPTTWLSGIVPGGGQEFTIVSNHVVTVTDVRTQGIANITETGSLVLNENLTVTSVNIGATASLNLSSYTLTVSSGTINNSGTFNAGTGTVKYNYSGSQDIATLTYNNLTIDGPGTKSLTGLTDINGILTINAVSTILNTNNNNINLGGNFVNNGTFTQGTGTVTFNGTTTISGSSTLTLGDLIISGTLTSHTSNVNISGNWQNNGTFNHNNGTITFTGTTAISGTSATIFYSISVSGTLTAPNTTDLYIERNWTNNGTFTHNSGTVIFNGVTSMSGTSSNSFNNLSVNNSKTLTAAASSNTNVAGNWVNNGSFTHSSGTVVFNGISVISGTGTHSFYNITVSGTMTAPATMNIARNFVNNGTFTHNSGSITFNGTTIVSGTSTTVFNNITISGILTGHATRMDVAGNFINNGTYTHNNGTVYFTGVTALSGTGSHTFSAVTISGTLTSPASGTIYIAGNWVNNGTFNTNSGTITFNGTSTISGSSAHSFNNISITGTMTAPASITINGNWMNIGTFSHNNGLTTFAGTTLISGTSGNTFYDIAISGILTNSINGVNITHVLTNNGTFNHNNGTVTFNGSVAQSIGGTSNTTFYNLIVNNSSATGIVLSRPTTVTHALTLTDGYIFTDAVNLLIFNDNATTTTGSSGSFIDGPAKKIGNDVFTFPVGDWGIWAPIKISNLSGATPTDAFTAVFNMDEAPNQWDLGSGIHHVSYVEYWDLTRNTATPNSGDVTLYWKAADVLGITSLTDLVFAHFDGTSWEDMSGVIVGGSTVGVAGTGGITANLSSFSPLTFASKVGTNPLPVELLKFSAKPNGEDVDLSWSTASETNNDYFTIERTSDFENIQEIAEVDGAGNSNVFLEYRYIDEEPLTGISYYRLKQTDFDGKSTYSDWVSVILEIEDKFEFIVYPNPARIGEPIFMKLKGLTVNKEVLVVVKDVTGREYYSKVFITNETDNSIFAIDPYSKISPGVYFVIGSSDNSIYFKKIIFK
ncbi:MAG TPA: hypothetical protein DEH02_05815 [Bacteroidales bacterium]|nr:hypothetical protein [Bacteroidales bacterium]